MKKYKLALIGATGVIGTIARTVLEEKQLPLKSYMFFSSQKSAGKKIKFMKKNYTIKELTKKSFDSSFDFAIFCANSEVSKEFVPIAASKNCIVVDNSSAFRLNKNVPLIIPEVNLQAINNHNNIIANPNCSTIQAVIALKPLDDNYEIKRIVYSTYQAVSGAGISGIENLKNGIYNYISDEPYTLKNMNYPIFNNCIPHIDDFTETFYTKEEEKLINETRKILNKPDLPITATAVRVPVFNCHSESINIEFEKDFNITDLINLLKISPGITVLDDPKNNIYPVATNATGQNQVFVGRIRRDFSVKSGINLWVVSDNTRKGAATNAIQIVENLINLL